MRHATVARMVKDRGFAFLADNETGKEYFFHKTVCQPHRSEFDRMQQGTSVVFEIDLAAPQPRAAVVQIQYGKH